VRKELNNASKEYSYNKELGLEWTLKYIDCLITLISEDTKKACLDALPSEDNGLEDEGLSFNKGHTAGFNDAIKKSRTAIQSVDITK